MNRSARVLGGILVVFGILFLMKNFAIFDPVMKLFNIGYIFSRFWPAMFLLLPGLIFHYGYFSGGRRSPGLLVPGGILLVLGLVFQFNMLFGGWDITWPLIIFSVAFGLFELYIFGNRERGLLIPIGILGGLSFLFFFSFSLSRLLSFNTRPYAMPILLIGVGLILISGAKKSRA
ncbi:MAG: hypothetical protein GX940_09785 [Clostridiaceae bacterium]|jgi:hypothetical protein|nr:hypothetical protein [Clostridiaceae bacterium]